MPTVAMTAQWVDRVRPPAAGQVDYFDSKMPGFALRVSSKGTRSWVYLYRVKGDPKKRRLTLGQYPAMTLADARESARRLQVEIDRGSDPAAAKQEERGAPSFESLAVEYSKKYACQKKSGWRDERYLTGVLVPRWGRKKAQEVTKADVLDFLDEVKARGHHTQANRYLALVRKVYNWGIERGIVDVNPCDRLKAPSPERARERVLSDAELRAVWQAIEGESAPISALFKTRILTAQRGGEVILMRWKDIDFESGWWTIPAEHAKNGYSHRVPLTGAVTKILIEMRDIQADAEWVFPGKRRGFPLNNIAKPTARIRTASGVDFVPHDLRRTAASLMSGLGVPRLTISRILNHTEGGVTWIYDRHSYDSEKREALEKWSERLFNIVGRDPSNLPYASKAGE